MNSRIAILALAAAVSCTSQIIVEPEDKSVKVIMNAQLNTGMDGAWIYLGYSNVTESKSLSGANVFVSVNGGAAVKAIEQEIDESDGWNFRATPYYYTGTFNAAPHPFCRVCSSGSSS